MERIPYFVNGHPTAVLKLNEIIRQLHKLAQISGDGFVNVSQTNAGLTFRLNWPALRKKLPALQIHYAKVIRGLQHADPDDSDNPDGFKKYVMRLLSEDGGDVNDFDGGTDYYEGDKVLFSDSHPPAVDFMFVSTYNGVNPGSPNIDSNHFPTGNPGWVPIDIIPKGIATTTSNYDLSVRIEEEELRQFVRWFEADDIVPLIRRDDEWYIFATLFPVGDIPNCSITWLEDENRVAAVYKG